MQADDEDKPEDKAGDKGEKKPAKDTKGPAPKAAAHSTEQIHHEATNGGRTLPFTKATPSSNVAKKAVDTAQNAYLDVQKASQDPTR